LCFRNAISLLLLRPGLEARAASTFFESSLLAFSSSARLAAVRPFPPRFRKYVNIRIPDAGPFGETDFDASAVAIVLALLVNSPSGGCVESVWTFATHRFFAVFFFAIFRLTVIFVSLAQG
jgi:hypothetical protein